LHSRRPIIETRRFEKLLSEISAKYINLPVDKIEEVVRDDLGCVAMFLGGDCCCLQLFDQDEEDWLTLKDVTIQSFIWQQPEVPGAIDWESIARDPAFRDYMQYIYDRWNSGQDDVYTDVAMIPDEAEKLRTFLSSIGVKSLASVPITVAGERVGSIVVYTTGVHQDWPPDMVTRVRLFGEVFANALARKRSEKSLRAALAELKQLKEQLEADYTYLREEINIEHNFSEVVGSSSAVKNLLKKVEQVAHTDVTVLLLGETGTGKGVTARLIHNMSKRKDRPLVQVNCAALSPALIESELFGYEKGAFTGAGALKIGRFELARGTTLFLDEIGDLNLDLQAKLLRVLQNGEFERVGGITTIRTDARIIAATNKDLEKEVQNGRFRRDLWYRLSVFPIMVPPLRDRVEDIPIFVKFFIDKYKKRTGKRFNAIPAATIDLLQRHSWPGNIRELENLVERAMIMSSKGHLHIEIPSQPTGQHFDESAPTRSLPTSPKKDGESLADMEREHILAVLNNTYGRIDGPHGAARRLGLNAGTLRSRMKKLGIKRSDVRHQ
jgi:transcriptional regulator with GAF, ATPase, and Fis domain